MRHVALSYSLMSCTLASALSGCGGASALGAPGISGVVASESLLGNPARHGNASPSQPIIKLPANNGYTAINNLSEIIGCDSTRLIPFVYQNGAFTDIPSTGPSSVYDCPTAISDAPFGDEPYVVGGSEYDGTIGQCVEPGSSYSDTPWLWTGSNKVTPLTNFCFVYSVDSQGDIGGGTPVANVIQFDVQPLK
jgi:hypothetical protein